VHRWFFLCIYKFLVPSFMCVQPTININGLKSLSHKCILDFSFALMGFGFFHSCVLATCNQCQLFWVLKSWMRHWIFLCAPKFWVFSFMRVIACSLCPSSLVLKCIVCIVLNAYNFFVLNFIIHMCYNYIHNHESSIALSQCF
jgi:hypothetical protein